MKKIDLAFQLNLGPNMKIGISTESQQKWINEFIKAADYLGINYILVNISDFNWKQQLEGIDLFIWRISLNDITKVMEAKQKIKTIENMGIHCFPNSLMTLLYDDKIAQTYFFEQYFYPTPKNMISFSYKNVFEELNNIKYPIVTKLKGGASSKNVALLNSASELKTILDAQIFFSPLAKIITILAERLKLPSLKKLLKEKCGYVYLQEFIPTDGDYRIVTFGNNYFSIFKRLNRKNDFRASGSGRWEQISQNQLPSVAISAAFEISERHNFACMAYDFVVNSEKWYILEMSYGFLLSDIYTKSLFKKVDNKFIKTPPIPIGQLIIDSIIKTIKNN